MKPAEIDIWVDTYIRYHDSSNSQSGKASDFWASERFMDSDPKVSESHWNAILLIVERSSDRSVIGNLAAGPLEDLISNHGSEYIDRIETKSRQEPRFRDLLGGVWKCGSPDIWARIEKARNNESW